MGRQRGFVASLALALTLAGGAACEEPGASPQDAAPGQSSAAKPSNASDQPEPKADTKKKTHEADTGGASSGDGRQTIEVTRVIDGDTFEARGLDDGPVPGRVVDVRMLEINTVEQGECGYQASTAKLASLLGDRVTIERDQDLKDQYGRWLLYVWNSDGTFVNLQMVAEGWAEAVLYEPNDKYWSRINTADTSDTYTPWPPCNTPEPQQDQPREDDADGTYPVPPPPPDRDCSEIDATDFQVRPGDPHRFDADGDGTGCES